MCCCWHRGNLARRKCYAKKEVKDAVLMVQRCVRGRGPRQRFLAHQREQQAKAALERRRKQDAIFVGTVKSGNRLKKMLSARRTAVIVPQPPQSHQIGQQIGSAVPDKASEDTYTKGQEERIKKLQAQ